MEFNLDDYSSTNSQQTFDHLSFIMGLAGITWVGLSVFEYLSLTITQDKITTKDIDQKRRESLASSKLILYSIFWPFSEFVKKFQLPYIPIPSFLKRNKTKEIVYLNWCDKCKTLGKRIPGMNPTNITKKKEDEDIDYDTGVTTLKMIQDKEKEDRLTTLKELLGKAKAANDDTQDCVIIKEI